MILFNFVSWYNLFRRIWMYSRHLKRSYLETDPVQIGPDHHQCLHSIVYMYVLIIKQWPVIFTLISNISNRHKVGKHLVQCPVPSVIQKLYIDLLVYCLWMTTFTIFWMADLHLVTALLDPDVIRKHRLHIKVTVPRLTEFFIGRCYTKRVNC